MTNQSVLVAALLCSTVLGCERDPVLPREPVVAPPSGPLAARQGADLAGLNADQTANSGSHHDAPPKDPTATSDREAEAKFEATAGSPLTGEAEFEETEAGLRVEVEIKSAPAGLKGIHVHEKGDCSNLKGKSMGAHFSPEQSGHGLPSAPTKHLGDLGNVKIEPDGEGKLEILVPKANLKPDDAFSFLGKALVIHASEDKGTGETGEAGEPVACAVIKAD